MDEPNTRVVTPTNDFTSKTLLKNAKSYSPVHREDQATYSEGANDNRNYSYNDEKVESNTTGYFKMGTNMLINTEEQSTPSTINKNFLHQDTNMSFRADHHNAILTSNKEKAVPQNKEIQDEGSSYKAKIDKEYYESQIANLKQTLTEEKARYEDLHTEEKEKAKKRELENNRFVEELRNRQKEEILSLEERYKSRIISANEENRRIRSEIDKEIQNERDRMNVLNKSDHEMQEALHTKNMEQQKKFFEDQNETLKKQLQQQIEFNKLASKVEVSSKQIDEIVDKFLKEKEKSLELEKSTINNQESFLKDQEEKIKESAKLIQLEKESLMKMRQDFELREIEKKKENHEEKSRIEREVMRLQELQNSLKILEFNAKEKYEREKLEIMQKHNDMKQDLDGLKNDYHQKNIDLEYQRKMLVEEKNFFDKYKEEAIK